MAPAATSRVRKRNRKRKRRNVSLSSASSSSASSSEDEPTRVVPAPSTAPPTATAGNDSGSDSDSDSSSSASSSSSPSISSDRPIGSTKDPKSGPLNETTRRQSSRSPTPPDTALPPLISTNPTTDAEKEKEKVLKEKFRKFWMQSVAEEFKDDLEQIRKEPNMTTSRLSLLIDALASGADVFSTVAPTGSGNQINEIELVLGPSKS